MSTRDKLLKEDAQRVSNHNKACIRSCDQRCVRRDADACIQRQSDIDRDDAAPRVAPVMALQSSLREAIDWPDGRHTCGPVKKVDGGDVKIAERFTCTLPPLPPIAIALLFSDMQRMGSSKMAGDLMVLITFPVDMVHTRMVLSSDDVNMMWFWQLMAVMAPV